MTAHASPQSLRVPLIAGAVIGVAQAALPFAFWWLPPATVYALSLVFIAAVYIGLSVADGRSKVIAAESAVATVFVVVAAAAVTGPGWLLVAGLTGHGAKDLWQHHTQFVTGTRWWPPFCAAVDFVAATILAVALAAGIDLTECRDAGTRAPAYRAADQRPALMREQTFTTLPRGKL